MKDYPPGYPRRDPECSNLNEVAERMRVEVGYAALIPVVITVIWHLQRFAARMDGNYSSRVVPILFYHFAHYHKFILRNRYLCKKYSKCPITD